MSPYASGTLWRLEQWIDTFDAYLIDNDILDYPGAEKAADAERDEYDAVMAKAYPVKRPGAVFEYNPSSLASVMNDWYLAPPKRVKRQHLLMEQQRRSMSDDYERKMVGWWESNRLPSERGRP